MNEFREWLSDNLRYFELGFAIILVIVALVFGFRYLSNEFGGEKNPDGDKQVVQESDTDLNETETDTDETEENTAETDAEGTGETKTDASEEETDETETDETETDETETDETETDEPETETEPVTETETETETEAPETSAPEPIYMTMNGAAYLRNAPSYDGEIIGEYPAGTVVIFLYEEAGWYKIDINGTVGYMGPRFLH